MPSRCTPARAWTEAAFVVLLPPVLFVAYSVCPINQAVGIDPFVYTGYINNFRDLIDRYGLTYYAVRFGLILPGLAFTQILGAKAGYFALVSFFYLVAGIPLYLALRKHFGTGGACLGYVTFVSSVWIARTMLWQYVDSAAVAYLIGALGLIVSGPAPRRMTYVVVGVLCGLAVHSQAFATAFVILAAVPYAVVNWGTLRSRMWPDTVSVVAGVLGVTCGGVLFYWWTVGEWNIFRPTLAMVLLDKAHAAGARPKPGWWLSMPWLLYPPFVLAGAGLLWLRRSTRSPVFAASFLYAVACLAFFSLWDFYGVGWAISSYFSMLAASVVPLACLIPAVLVTAGRFSTPQYVLAGILMAIAPAVWATFDGAVVRMGRGLAVMAIALALAAIGWSPRHRVISLAACALFVAGAHVSFVAGNAGPSGSRAGMKVRSTYAQIVDSPLGPAFAARRSYEWGSYGIALQLMSAMPKIAADGAPLRFWYTWEPPAGEQDRTVPRVGTIQSTYLWAYSRLQGSTHGLPEIGSHERALLRGGGPFHLAVLATNRERLGEARAALAREGIRYSSTFERKLCERTLCLWVELLGIQATAGYWISGGPAVAGHAVLAAEARGLEPMLERWTYGWWGKSRVLVWKGDRLIFTPTSRNDLLATPFVSVAEHRATQAIALRLISRMPERPLGRCEMIVQTGTFNTLAHGPCRDPHVGEAGPSVFEFAVPADTSAIRLLLVSADGRATDLPSSVRIEVFADRSRQGS